MTDSEILSWLESHHATIEFGLFDYALYVSGYTYRTGTTLEEAIAAMEEQIQERQELKTVEGAVVKQLAEVEQLMLLGQGSEG